MWLVGIAFAGLGFFMTFLEKEITLRTKLNTKFGIDETKGGASAAKGDTEIALSDA